MLHIWTKQGSGLAPMAILIDLIDRHFTSVMRPTSFGRNSDWFTQRDIAHELCSRES